MNHLYRDSNSQFRVLEITFNDVLCDDENMTYSIFEYDHSKSRGENYSPHVRLLERGDSQTIKDGRIVHNIYCDSDLPKTVRIAAIGLTHACYVEAICELMPWCDAVVHLSTLHERHYSHVAV